MMTSENNITINVRVTFWDILHASRLYRETQTARKYSDQVLAGMMAVFIWGGYLLFLAIQPELLPSELLPPELLFLAAHPWTKTVAIVLLVIGWALVFDLGWIIGSWLQYRRNRQFYLQPRQVRFDQAGMTIQAQNVNGKYDWEFYKDTVEGQDEFLLIYGNDLYFNIPKTSFQNETEIAMFRNMLRMNLPTFKQKLKFAMDFRWKKAA